MVLLILHADHVRRLGKNRQRSRRQQPPRLQLLAAQADDHRRAAEVRIETEIAQCANRNLRAGCVDRDAAPVIMGQRDDVVDVGKARQYLRFDALDRKVDGGRDALHGRGDAEDILRAHRPIVIKKTFEGVALKRRHRRGYSSRERQVLQRRSDRQTHPLLMHPTPLRNRAICVSDDRAIAHDRRFGRHVHQRDLMRLGNVFDQRQPRIEPRARWQSTLVHDDGDRVPRMDLNVEWAQCFARHAMDLARPRTEAAAQAA